MQKFVIAATYRDISIWSDEVCEMIDEHHKTRPAKNSRNPLAETFRRADLVDFSLGLVKHDILKAFVNEAKTSLPNANFHKMLVKLT